MFSLMGWGHLMISAQLTFIFRFITFSSVLFPLNTTVAVVVVLLHLHFLHNHLVKQYSNMYYNILTAAGCCELLRYKQIRKNSTTTMSDKCT